MTLWHAHILTLFPDMFPGPLAQSLSGKALEKGLWSYDAIDIRAFALDRHRTVDDTPFGGGAGMVMRPDVIESALLSIAEPGRKIYLSARGRPLNQRLVEELARTPRLTLLCGRYEGVDQRVVAAHGFEELSIGDYVLSGGEPAALILMDACIRLLEGVMGNPLTSAEESHGPDNLVEYPQYTRPARWVDASGKTWEVPDVLLSGNHAAIARWRRAAAEEATRRCRRLAAPASEPSD